MDLFDEQLIIQDNSTGRRRRASSYSVPLVQPRKLLNQSASLDVEAVLLRIGDGQVCKICYHADNAVIKMFATFSYLVKICYSLIHQVHLGILINATAGYP